MSKHQIQVRRVEAGHSLFDSSAPFTVVGTIKRKLKAEQVGNLVPVFCTYRGAKTLVHSNAGDLSDPFRVDASYTQSLFIRVS